MPYAPDTVNMARRFRDELDYELIFLTALPRGNDMPWASWDKMHWAMTHFPDIPVHLGPYSEDKQIRSAPGNILVDDHPGNCEQWRSCGGTAVNVLLGSEQLAIQVLEQIYLSEISLKNMEKSSV
jgi:hypothetical protein